MRRVLTSPEFADVGHGWLAVEREITDGDESVVFKYLARGRIILLTLARSLLSPYSVAASSCTLHTAAVASPCPVAGSLIKWHPDAR